MSILSLYSEKKHTLTRISIKGERLLFVQDLRKVLQFFLMQSDGMLNCEKYLRCSISMTFSKFWIGDISLKRVPGDEVNDRVRKVTNSEYSHAIW